jgi:hypothetical protein
VQNSVLVPAGFFGDNMINVVRLVSWRSFVTVNGAEERYMMGLWHCILQKERGWLQRVVECPAINNDSEKRADLQ